MTSQVPQKDIVCTKCGLVNDYRTEMKANNKVAYCNGCDSFITNIPYQQPMLYVGKYKGVPISSIHDASYLEWAVNTLKLSEHVRAAINTQIQFLRREAV
jgi:hypothetical protein